MDTPPAAAPFAARGPDVDRRPRRPRPSAAVAPETLHPELWRAHQLGSATGSVVGCGWEALDRQLPGGGWPKRVLTELLVKHPGVGEMRLLAPALARIARGDAGLATEVMLFDPPAQPCAWAMAQLGIEPRSLIVVRGRDGTRGAAVRQLLGAADVLWALEQALRSGHAGAVLAWLPERLRADALRRLQLAAQAHDGPVFLLRGLDARLKPSPSPLRLMLHPSGADGLSVQILKRRGPALPEPLSLALPAVVAVPRQGLARGGPGSQAPVRPVGVPGLAGAGRPGLALVQAVPGR